MNEETFWRSLEYRISSELAGLQSDFRHLWCDGISPGMYYLDEPDPRITGSAWLLLDSLPKARRDALRKIATAESQWSFTLILKWRAKSPQHVRWESLLPPPNVTKWLSLDLPSLTIRIDPAAAEPDRVV